MKQQWIKYVMAGMCATAAISGWAQEPSTERDVDEQLQEPMEGPRGDKVFYGDYGLLLILPGGETDSLQNEGWSNTWWYGLVYQRNFSRWFGLGGELAFTRSAYRVTQNVDSLPWSDTGNDVQKFIQSGFMGSVHARLQLSQRGNNMGRYLDLGAYTEFYVGDRLYTKNEVDPALNNGATEIRTEQRKLDFVNAANYGVYARLGFGAFYLSGRYRLSDVFQASNNINGGAKIPEFERLAVGIGLLFYTP